MCVYANAMRSLTFTPEPDEGRLKIAIDGVNISHTRQFRSLVVGIRLTGMLFTGPVLQN